MPLELSALRGNVPVSFMAALGLLRVAPAGCRLSWTPVTQQACLEGIDRDALLDHLVAHMKNRSASAELHLADDVRGMTQARYRDLVAVASDATLEWVRAFWWEDGDEVRPTALCFTSGNQRMIKMARELATHLDPDSGRGAPNVARQKFTEAIFEPWQYVDDIASWGWDPTTYRLGANTSEAPMKMKLEGVAAAYWLAWESIPLFPNIPGQGTVNFDYRPNARGWSWTTWGTPLDAHAVKALLRRPAEGEAIGGQRYRSGIIKAGHYQFFEPARIMVEA